MQVAFSWSVSTNSASAQPVLGCENWILKSLTRNRRQTMLRKKTWGGGCLRTTRPIITGWAVRREPGVDSVLTLSVDRDDSGDLCSESGDLFSEEAIVIPISAMRIDQHFPSATRDSENVLMDPITAILAPAQPQWCNATTTLFARLLSTLSILFSIWSRIFPRALLNPRMKRQCRLQRSSFAPSLWNDMRRWRLLAPTPNDC